ncbi:uncharacterized protein LOC144151494 isoform X1 [Haemaphysalis longicornis]
MLRIGRRVAGGALTAAMDSRFSLCLCHPRSQPARSDKRIPARASRTSFTVRVRNRLRPPLSLTLASCLIALAPSRKHALLIWLGRYTSPSVLSTELDDVCFVQRCSGNKSGSVAVRLLLCLSASLPVPARRNHGPRIRPPPAYAYRPPPSRAGPSSRRPECRSSRAVHGCACLEIIKPCLQSTASYVCVLITTLEDGAVIEPSRMPFESSCSCLRLS